jgi:hypothetical protein
MCRLDHADDRLADRFAKEISEGVKRSKRRREPLALECLCRELDTMIPLVRRVMRQTRARILRGNTRVEGKILSLFEPSTEVIRKGKAGKPNEFGKIIKLQEAENQIIIDNEVYARQPSDRDLLIPAIQTHQTKLGRVPRLVATMAASIPPGMRPLQKRCESSVGASQSVEAEPPAQTRSEEALVPRWPEMANGVRATDQRYQAAQRSQPLPVQGRRWNAALGCPRRDLRQSRQHGSGDE